MIDGWNKGSGDVKGSRIGKIRSIRFITEEVAVIVAIGGTVMGGESVWCVSCKHHVTDHQTVLVTYSMRDDTALVYYFKKCPRRDGCHEFRGR